MNERLAFFCDRDRAPGHLGTWVQTDGGSTTLYQVWSRAPLTADPPAPDGSVQSRPDAGPPIRTRITAGGLIAATRATDTAAELRIATVSGAGYDPAAAVLVLRPGLDPEWLPLVDGALTLDAATLGPADFLLVPATRTDQANLEGFLDQLRRLPDDYQSLILNVLRRPGIEGALGRLERRLAGLADAAGRAAAPPPARPPRDTWPWVLAGLLVLNLLAVLGAAWWLRGQADAARPLCIDHLEWPTGTPSAAPWPPSGAPGFARPAPHRDEQRRVVDDQLVREKRE